MIGWKNIPYFLRLTVATLCLSSLPDALCSQDIGALSDQRPVRFRGNLELRGIYYQAKGIPARREPFTYVLSGNPVLSLYGWDIPVSFVWSRDQRSFRQPFNQFGMSPSYRWAKLHVGYRNVTFSPYTLAGHTMLGGGFEINPGKLRLGLMYGRLNRATVIDTTTQSLAPYSFTRKGLAGRVGMGSSTTYFDINFLHAKDDSSSGPASRLPDATRILPAANSVLGYSLRVQLAKKLFVESDGAVSVYTRDILSPLEADSTIGNLAYRLTSLLSLNGTSEFYKALSAGVGYKSNRLGVRLTYRRIDPDFRSMGAYFFSNDVENITFAPDFRLLQGKVRFTGSVGVQRDNLSNQKQYTSRRLIGSGSLGAELSNSLGVDVNFSNFSNNRSPNTLRIADTLKIVQTNRVLHVMPRYLLRKNRLTHLVTLSVNLSEMNDYNTYFSDESSTKKIQNRQAALQYNVTIPEKKIAFSGGISYTGMESASIATSYQALTLGSNYLTPDGRVRAGISVSAMRSKRGEQHSFLLNGSANGLYKINKMHAFRGTVFFTDNHPGSAVTGEVPRFSETRAELAYQLQFGL